MSRAPWIVLDSGPLTELDGPERSSADRDRLLDDLVSLVEGLSGVVRPLAFEAQFVTYDEYGLPKEFMDNTWLTVSPLPEGVLLHSSVVHTSPPLEVARIGTAEVRRALSPRAPDQEWHHLRFLVTAARVVGSDPSRTTLDRLPSRPIPTIELDGQRWAVGPVDFFAMSRYLPVAVEIDQMGFGLQARIEPRWSPWVNEDTDEHKALMKAIADLSARGFRPHPLE